MHLGKSYKLSEFLIWTRRRIYVLLLAGVVPVALYDLLGLTWMTLPFSVVAILGSATSFIVGFKNVQTYNRTIEAQHIWTAILSESRFWGTMSRDFLDDPKKSGDLIRRHLAWLTCLRYQLRAPRAHESVDHRGNSEYQAFYTIPERETDLSSELKHLLSAEELTQVTASSHQAMLVLSNQARVIKQLQDEGAINLTYYIELNKIVRSAFEHQGRSERLKNFPYPRQYAIINTFFVRAFCFLLPFGMLKEFDKLNDGITGFMQGHMIWLVVPFSVVVSWMFTSLEQVGESTENPFEGSANDVPISFISKSIARDLGEMMGEKNIPPLPAARNDIIL